MYLFDDFQIDKPPGFRRPPCDSLLDVFENICLDEGEHVRTMKACQNYAQLGNRVASPHAAEAIVDKVGDAEKRRAQWLKWATHIND